MQRPNIEKIGVMDQLMVWTVYKGFPTVIQATIDLADSVDVDVLKAAVESNLKVFPNFRNKPVVHKNRFYFMENSGEAPVFEETDKRKDLCTADTNGYSFYVTYEDKKIHFVIAHFLSDGTGMKLFVSYVKKCYLRDRYPGEYEFDEAEAMNKSHFEDIIDPVDLFEQKLNSKDKKDVYRPKKGAFYVSGPFDPDGDSRLVVSMAEEDIAKLAKGLGVTPVAIMTTVFNTALKKVYNLENENIVSAAMVDIRRRARIFPLRNFSGVAYMPVNSDDLKSDLREECKAAGKRLKKSLKSADFGVGNQKKLVKVFNLIPGSLNTRLSLAKKIIGDAAQGILSYTISYLREGRPSDWERSKVLDETYEIIQATTNSPFAAMFSYRGVETWEFFCLAEKEKMGKAIVETLSEMGIECEVTERVVRLKCSFDLDRIETV